MKRVIAFLLIALLLVPVLAQQPVRRPIFPSGSTLNNDLVSYWKLDEASGTRADSVGSNHLTDNNTVGSTTGILNSCADFVAASSERLSIADNATLRPATFSFSFWYKTSTSDRFALSKISGNSGYDAGLTTAGNLFIRIGTGSAVPLVTDVITTHNGNWHHCVGTYDGTTYRLYRDGVQRATGTHAYSSAISQPFYLGVRNNLSDYWNGQIDEVGFWSRHLTADEVTELYNSSSGKAYPFN